MEKLTAQERGSLGGISRAKNLKDRYLASPKLCKTCGGIIPYERKRKSNYCAECSKANKTKNCLSEFSLEYAAMAGKKSHEDRLKREDDYDKSPTRCLNCGTPFSYERRNDRFCNATCAAIFKRKIPPEPGNYKVDYLGYSKECGYCGVIIERSRMIPIGEKVFCSHDHQALYYTEEKFNGGQSMKGATLRYYLLHTREYKCEQCGLSEWCGEPIPLDVHHIDGDSKNNNSENLQLLCKNCHGQTDNYGAKNKGNGTRNLYYIKKSDRDKRNNVIKISGG